MESFMEVGQGPNWGCSAKRKKVIKKFMCLSVQFTNQLIDFWVTLYECIILK
jgi:hypothetical protein